MKNNLRQRIAPASVLRRKGGKAGFSLIELMVAMAVFLLIGGAAVSLVRKHAPLASSQQNQVGLTMSLRNAIAQMEVDVVNAGSGYYPGANIAAWPIGITIANSPQGSPCNTASTFTYGPNCFDTLHVISTDPSTPPSHPTDSATQCVSSTSSTLFLNPIGSTTPAALASHYHAGDEVLLLSSDGKLMTTITITAPGGSADPSGKVKIPHNPTGANGTSNDPLLIASTADANKLGTTFCTNDWALKLAPVTYSVDTTTDPSNPQLIRTAGGTSDVVAQQIIGFRVGASIRTATSDQPYNFNASAAVTSGGYNNDFAQIRAVRISLLGRTPPNSDPTNTFRNSFDGGPYKIEGVSVTINPRNLSMGDQ
jgi:prepilin-type N-terminal cleavage/methylation domain-containing protein